MPDNDASTAAAWNAAGQISSATINAMAQTKLNKKTMKYNDDWAYRQREWALADWHMQNDYNLPINQRARMIAAGINPALMYGKGPGELTSGPVRAGSSPNWHPTAPKFDLSAGSSIMTYLGVQKQTAEIANINAQTDLLKEKHNTQIAQTKLTWDKSRFTQTQNEQLQQIVSAVENYNVENPRDVGVNGNYYVEKFKADIDNREQQIIINAAENLRRENRNNVSMAMILQQTVNLATQNIKDKAEIGRINAQTNLIIQSGILSQFDIDASQVMNRNLSGPAGQVLKAILQKLLPAPKPK